MTKPPTARPLRLKMISFRADEAVDAAVERLAEAVGGGVINKNRRSIAIRRALLEADERLRGVKKRT